MSGSGKIYRNILSMTKIIRDDFPELIHFLDETPCRMSQSTDCISEEDLKDYYDSLDGLFINYSLNHLN